MTGAAPLLARLDASARPARTRSAAGTMVWRSWGEGPPMVLLHGNSGSWRHWARNIDRLGARRRLWVPDLPGMGDSDVPDPAIGRPEVARILCAATEELLGGASYDLMGFSYGGSVAGILAGLAPGLVRSLTLVGSAGFGAQVRRPPMTRLTGLQGAERMAAHRENLLNLMIADPARLDPLAVEIQDENTRRRRMKPPADRHMAFLPAALGTFQGRLNAVWGARDQFAGDTLPQRVAQLRAARPEADVSLIDNAGHWVAYEAAEAFNGYVLSRLPLET